MNCPPPTNSIAGFASLITGTNIGKHGIYNFGTLDTETGNYYMSNAKLRATKTIWEIMSEQDKRIITLNLRGMYPPEKINGILISGPFVPLDHLPYTHPAHLTEELVRYKYTAPFTIRPRDSGIMFKKMDEVVYLTEYLLDNCAWDCFIVGILEPDDFHARFGNDQSLMRRLYLKIDKIIGRLLRYVDDKTSLIITCDHGISSYTKSVHLERWLWKEGHLVLKSHKDIIREVQRKWSHDGFSSKFKWLLYKYSVVLKKLIHPFLFQKHYNRWLQYKERELNIEPIDWNLTKVYRSRVDGSSSNSGGVRINRKCRLVNLKSVHNYERLRTELIERLVCLQDPKTSKNMVNKVYLREELYHGPCLERIPDLIVVFDEDYKVERYLPHVESITCKNLISKYTIRQHTHSQKGVFLAYGRGIKPQAATALKNVDVAPTILYLLGLPITRYMDGRVLEEVIDDDLFNLRPIEKVELPLEAYLRRARDYSKAEIMKKHDMRRLNKVIYEGIEI